MTDIPAILSLEDRQRLVHGFLGHVPHNKALGIELGEADDAKASMRLPYGEHLVGDPQTGVLHGGVVTTLIDSACGAAVFMALPRPMPVATLDLRIDYLQAAGKGHTLVARAHCYKLTSNVAFVRCDAVHEDDTSVIVAQGTGTFMLATKYGSVRDAVKVEL